MASRYALGQALQQLGLSAPCVPNCVLPIQAARRLISTSIFHMWPDVVVPSMGESIKEGSIAAVLKQVGQQVQEDEVIAQIETDKVTIDIKAPTAGVMQQLLIKPSDLVVAGQVVAVVGAGEAAAPAAPAVASSTATATAAASVSTSSRSPSIHFPPRVTAMGTRISELPEPEYSTALAAAEAAAKPAASHATAMAEAAHTTAPPAPAVEHPMPAAKAAPPPFSKNKLQYITRPDGRGGPPRRPLTERELDMINLGGVY